VIATRPDSQGSTLITGSSLMHHYPKPHHAQRSAWKRLPKSTPPAGAADRSQNYHPHKACLLDAVAPTPVGYWPIGKPTDCCYLTLMASRSSNRPNPMRFVRALARRAICVCFFQTSRKPRFSRSRLGSDSGRESRSFEELMTR